MSCEKNPIEMVAQENQSQQAQPMQEMQHVKLQLPLNKDELAQLHVGDSCLLTGYLYALRDAGHIRLLAEMNKNPEAPLPYELEGQAIFYVGPTPERSQAERPFGAAGPTTSSRMDFATPLLYDKGIVATIGKGVRSEEVHEACVRNGAIYFVTVGGAAAYLAKCVQTSEVIAYDDLGTEALRRLYVVDFPVFVGIDTCGNDIYTR